MRTRLITIIVSLSWRLSIRRNYNDSARMMVVWRLYEFRLIKAAAAALQTELLIVFFQYGKWRERRALRSRRRNWFKTKLINQESLMSFCLCATALSLKRFLEDLAQGEVFNILFLSLARHPTKSRKVLCK